MFEGMIVIGENINATRKVKAEGKKIVEFAPGRRGYPYPGPDGAQAHLDLTEELESELTKKSGRVNYLAAGIIKRDAGFLVALAQDQIDNGADLLDVCVDECSPDSDARKQHMIWCVKTLQAHVKTPLCIDSSDSEVIAAGLEAYDWSVGKAMINSVNLEPPRLPIIDVARRFEALLLANASGPEGIPPTAEGRVENLTRLMGMLDEAGIPIHERTLDPLVLPVSTDTVNPGHFLEACRRLRERFGDDFHLTGGLSNVSFGLPRRRTINEAFTWLSKQAGCDTAFIDPAQVRGFETEDEGFKLAVAALQGEDPFCMGYTAYARG